MIMFLLQDTTLSVKYQDHLGVAFKTNRGTPQGDGLSPVLLTQQ